MPTSSAACARDHLIVMTAEMLGRLVVTTRFVKVEVPDHALDASPIDSTTKKRMDISDKKWNEPDLPVFLAP